MHFAILASDGLWDTHSNEDAVSVIGNRWEYNYNQAHYDLSSFTGYQRTGTWEQKFLLEKLSVEAPWTTSQCLS